MFIDYVKIHLIAGNGGSGCLSFHREKFIDKGGPDGGDGGRGGSIIIIADKQLRTLQDYTYRRQYKAQRGVHGMGSNKHGKSGKDITLKAPLGTIIKNAETGEILVDLVENGQKFVAAKGGRGGRGNARFATPTKRSPRDWEVGREGGDIWLELELKLIADIGLVGLPNAGKSTLLSRISKARPKVAAYPFTTLSPMLGIVPYYDFQSYVVADIPGLIEGAHSGKGLGHQFLRHIERTRALAYLIDITEEDPLATYEILRNELGQYSKRLLKKPSILVFTKMDAAMEEQLNIKMPSDINTLHISAVRGDNLTELKDMFASLIEEADKIENEEIE
jgi:GTP-binding protein